MRFARSANVVEAFPFLASHVSLIAARAAELERLGEEEQNPYALVRAARLYTLAVRIADEIDGRAQPRFTLGDLARVRDELRALATDAAAAGILGDHGLHTNGASELRSQTTVAFREIAVRIEQRVVAGA